MGTSAEKGACSVGKTATAGGPVAVVAAAERLHSAVVVQAPQKGAGVVAQTVKPA